MNQDVNTSRAYATLSDRLTATHRLEQLWQLAYAKSISISVVVSVLTSVVLMEWWLHGSMQLRTVFFILPILLGLVSLAYASHKIGLFNSILTTAAKAKNTVALRVGKAYPELSDMLLNSMQLFSADKPHGSAELSQAVFVSVSEQARDKNFNVIIEKRLSLNAMYLALSSVAVFSILTAFTPHSFGAAFNRILHFSTSYLPSAPFTLHVAPKLDTLMRGESATIRISAPGIPPNTATLWIKEGTADRYSPLQLQPDSAGSFTFSIARINSTTFYYAEAAWLETGVVSDTGRIVVIDKPLIRSFMGTVQPPKYTGMANSSIDESHPDIATIVGSTVWVKLESNKQLERAAVVIERGLPDSAGVDSTVVMLNIEGRSAQGIFRVNGNATYHFALLDIEGQTNADPVRYTIVAFTDAYPTISMIQPRADVDVDPSAILPITVSVTDDYGFSSLKLYYRLAQSRYSRPHTNFTSIEIAFDKKSSGVEVSYLWNLAKVDITTEDVFEFYLEVADNDAVRGPKSARTGVLKVRHPSLDELFAETDKTHQDIQKELKEIVKETQQIKKEADELQREMQKQQSQSAKQMQWADKKKAEDLLKRQEQLRKKMEEATDKLENMTKKLAENKAISPETMQKYQELQKLMREVKSPELERMQKQMKQALDQMTPEQMEKMMQDVKFNEEEFRKNIERTMNLLKRTQAEQKTDELAKRAEELAEKQDELRQKAENTDSKNQAQRDKLEAEQKKLAEDFDKLAQEAKELERLMKELGQEMPTSMMDKAQEMLKEDQTKKDMNSAAQDMEKGDMESASQRQQKASDNLQRFAQQMKQMKREMRKNAQREAMKAMQKGMNDLLDLSAEQETLMKEMQSMDAGSSQFPQAAKKQKQMQEAMQNLANNMMALGQKSTSVSPEMAQDLGDALEGMQQSLQQMGERNSPGASQAQGNSMSSMNSALGKMSDALGQMMQGDGQGQGGQGQNPGQGEGRGMSPFQRLQKLAEQQQSINQGSQQQGGQGQQMSDQQRAEMGKLASQQGQALKAMQELEEEQKRNSGGKKPVGDLKTITEDMKEVLTDIQSGSITSETRMRQERILSRLLNASRSMNERDHEKTRESNSGVDVDRNSPSALDLKVQEEQKQTVKELMDKLKLGYSKDYENLIRMYLESLKKQSIQKGAVK